MGARPGPPPGASVPGGLGGVLGGVAAEGMVSALLHERDLYLAWSLKRSKAVNGTRFVVGVVGAGHVRGIVYAARHYKGDLRFRDLVGGLNRKRTASEKAAGIGRAVAREAAIALAFGIVLWLVSHSPEEQAAQTAALLSFLDL